MKGKTKKYLAFLIVFAMILSANVGAFTEGIPQDEPKEAAQNQVIPSEGETGSGSSLEGNEDPEPDTGLERSVEPLVPDPVVEPKDCEISYIAGDNGSIDGEAEQIVTEGKNTTEVTAVANDGYQFVSWDDGKLEATRYEENVIEDAIYTANFEPKEDQPTEINVTEDGLAEEDIYYLEGNMMLVMPMSIPTNFTFVSRTELYSLVGESSNEKNIARFAWFNTNGELIIAAITQQNKPIQTLKYNNFIDPVKTFNSSNIIGTGDPENNNTSPGSGLLVSIPDETTKGPYYINDFITNVNPESYYWVVYNLGVQTLTGSFRLELFTTSDGTSEKGWSVVGNQADLKIDGSLEIHKDAYDANGVELDPPEVFSIIVKGPGYSETIAVTSGSFTLLTGLDYGTYEATESALGYATVISEPVTLGTGNETGTITVTNRVETGAELGITNYEGVYDGVAHSIAVTGTVPGDTVSYSTDGGETWSTSNPSFTNRGEYEVEVRVTDTNFEVRYGTGTVTITARPVTITVNHASKVFGQSDPEITGTIDGLINENDLGEITYSRSNVDVNVVGVYEKVLVASFTVENPNYGLVIIRGNFTITPAKGEDLNITGYNGMYDGLGHSITVNNLLNGDTVTYSADGEKTWSTTNPTFINRGEYKVEVKVTNPNYAERTGTGTVTITARPVTITVNNASKVFGQSDPEITGTIDGLISENDLGEITYSRLNVDVNVVGVYEKVLVASFTVENPNYGLVIIRGNFTITPAKGEDLNITGYNGMYDGLGHSITVNNLLNGDTVSYSTDGGKTWSTTNPTFINRGEYKVEVKVTNPNYAERTGTGTVTITKRPITITANSNSRVYNGRALTDSGYRLSSGSLASEETITSVIVTGSQTSIGSSANVASAAVIMDDEVTTTSNYDISYIDGKLTVTRPTGGGGNDDDDDDEEEIIDEPIPEAVLNKEDHFQYIQGYPDNTVRPEGLITREEVSAVFYRLLTDKSRSAIWTTNENFPDVESSRWSVRHIATLANGNFIEGYPDGTFKPGSFITRAELATIASRFDSLSPFVSNSFSDIEGHWANEYINSASIKGWVNGYLDGTFKPNQYITRAEFVTLVNNVLDRRVKEENILQDAKQFPDLSNTKWYYEAMQEAIDSHHYLRLKNTYEEWIDIYYPILDM